jgi:hypothetical protein
MQGWRRRIAGKDLSALLEGRATVAIDAAHGRIRLRPVGDEAHGRSRLRPVGDEAHGRSRLRPVGDEDGTEEH